MVFESTVGCDYYYSTYLGGIQGGHWPISWTRKYIQNTRERLITQFGNSVKMGYRRDVLRSLQSWVSTTVYHQSISQLTYQVFHNFIKCISPPFVSEPLLLFIECRNFGEKWKLVSRYEGFLSQFSTLAEGEMSRKLRAGLNEEKKTKKKTK